MNMKKIVALVLSLMLLTGMLPCAMAETFESTIDWAAEYDVIVIGYGAAGASSAVNAIQPLSKIASTSSG